MINTLIGPPPAPVVRRGDVGRWAWTMETFREVWTMNAIAWDVYDRQGKLIDTVFHNKRADGGKLITSDDVKRGLVKHDGYPIDIRVRRGR